MLDENGMSKAWSSLLIALTIRSIDRPLHKSNDASGCGESRDLSLKTVPLVNKCSAVDLRDVIRVGTHVSKSELASCFIGLILLVIYLYEW